MFLITGGGSGIGSALALALSARDIDVLIIGRRKELLATTAAQSTRIKTLCADVSTQTGIDSIMHYLRDTPKISGLINNAGTIHPVQPILSITSEDWHQTLRTNLDAALFLPQQLHTKLQQGRVLNIGSGAAYFPIKAWAAYCVSKAALSMLTRCWQIESDSIAFASLMPGIVDTDMQDIARNSATMAPDQAQFYQRLATQGRLITPATVAEFIVWLLLSIDTDTYISKEWDIYDRSHHKAWLKAPHQVLDWNI